MKVIIKEFGVGMQIKSTGIELQVTDTDGQQLGDLVITMSKVIWCPGKTTRANGKALTWKKFIEMMNSASN